MPQFAVYYPIYEATCALLSGHNTADKAKVSALSIFAAGAAAGVGCWVVTYPIDVVKTRVQAAPPNTYSPNTAQTHAVLVFQTQCLRSKHSACV